MRHAELYMIMSDKIGPYRGPTAERPHAWALSMQLIPYEAERLVD